VDPSAEGVGPATVTWLGHSSVVLDLEGTRLLTDPLLRRHAGILRRRGPTPVETQWGGPDAVLLSHLHHDHAELASLRLLPAGVPIVTAQPNARWLRRRGLAGTSPEVDGWLKVGASNDVRVALCAAKHDARPMPHRPNAANGHLVRSSSITIWLAGDTSLFDGISLIREQAGTPIDVAVVPVSGWAPRLSEGHLGPWAAAEACARVGARSAIPVHWGTLHTPGGQRYPSGWMDRPGPEFVTALRELAPDCRPVVLAPGGRATLRPAGG
jgi:L-ascorbate metabolism protein UlaG (beta-lactamase superfamily)